MSKKRAEMRTINAKQTHRNKDEPDDRAEWLMISLTASSSMRDEVFGRDNGFWPSDFSSQFSGLCDLHHIKSLFQFSAATFVKGANPMRSSFQGIVIVASCPKRVTHVPGPDQIPNKSRNHHKYE